MGSRLRRDVPSCRLQGFSDGPPRRSAVALASLHLPQCDRVSVPVPGIWAMGAGASYSTRPAIEQDTDGKRLCFEISLA
jgi:hypothetical protein